jgi:hypothetical protein
MRPFGGALASLAVLAALAGCGGGGEAETTFEPGSNLPPPGRAAKEREAEPRPEREPETVAPSHCPAGVPGCRTTEGRIVYVEAVDPDGDGDAHFVIEDGQSITLPGLTAIDVRVGLRPHPLPGPGDLVSAAGPVQTGSYGQSQIHALELHVGS